MGRLRLRAMPVTVNPALDAFLRQFGGRVVFGQVLIRRAGSAFELRHAADESRPDAELRPLAVNDARDLAQTTADGAFRPLKSAPNLRGGWRLRAADAGDLERALDQLYPGALADWFAAASAAPPVTSYREFTNRQTGMYRITQALTDAQAADVIRAACHQRFCLKRRLWSVEGLASDAPADKSVIPCLEPCALLLEFARRMARMEKDDKITLQLAPGDVETLIAALERALQQSGPAAREAAFDSPGNPRRVQRLLHRLKPLAARPAARDEE